MQRGVVLVFASSASSVGKPSVMLHLFVEDADAVFDRAVKAGVRPLMPPAAMLWEDRHGQLADPCGHVWVIATHKEDLTREETERRSADFARMRG